MKHAICMPIIRFAGEKAVITDLSAKYARSELITENVITELTTRYPGIEFWRPNGDKSSGYVEVNDAAGPTYKEGVAWVGDYPSVHIHANNLTESELLDKLIGTLSEVLEMQYSWLRHRRIHHPVDLPKMEIFTND